MKDTCVICGKESPYNLNDHVDYRIGYIDGSGQGCFQPNVCKKTISIDIELIKTTPNDFDLGKKVRDLFLKTNN